ncbi:MAG TPA: DUF58 domain-containing protein, partial [Terriglobales bacterium]|nr:DUF58 domain-containing protein [Terriglobales bacterium]
MRDTLKDIFAGVDREAWIRFVIAVGGLLLSFAMALLSTVFSESGNMLASMAFASVALILAAVVGVTTVPYLARRVVVSRVRDAFNYEVTREGVLYVILTVLIGVAALNTGNNLLFLVVAAMLAAVLVSGVASAMNLKNVELEVVMPRQVFAQRHVLGRMILHVRRRLLPLFSSSVIPPKQPKEKVRWVWHRATFEFPKSTPTRRSWIRWPDVALERIRIAPSLPSFFDQRVYFPYIPAGDSGHADVDLFFPRRGRFVQNGFGLSTRFPFSFLVKTRRVPLTREIIVYPSVEPTDEFFEVLPLITGEFETYMRGRGYDLYRIREYEPEDSARHVDWKSTAKSGSLKVREFTREDERKMRLVFDNPAPGAVSSPAYERAVALAASLAWHFAGEHTEISFAGNGYDGDPDIYRFLEYLALIEPSAETSVLEKLRASDEYNLVLTPRPRGSIPTELWETS